MAVGNDELRKKIKTIIKFFNYESSTKWALEQEQFKDLDLKDKMLVPECHQHYQEEKQRMLRELNEIAETTLIREPNILKDLFEKALSSEIVTILAHASVRTGSAVVLPSLVKSFKRVNNRAKCAILRTFASTGGVSEYSFLKNLLNEEKDQVIKDEATKAIDEILQKEPLLEILHRALYSMYTPIFSNENPYPPMVQYLLNYFTIEEQIKILGFLDSKDPDIFREIVKELKVNYKKTKVQKGKLKGSKSNDLALLIATQEDSAEDIMQEAAKSFWGAGKKDRKKMLYAMKPDTAVKFLRSGLRGTAQQVIFALNFAKNEYRSLVGPLVEDVISLCSGDNLEICCLTGEILLQEKPEYFSRHRWLVMRLASIAGGNSPLEIRLPLIIAMASLSAKQQYLYITHCVDRDATVEALIARSKWTELISLIRVSLLRWETDVESTADLAWLIKTFLEIREACQRKEIPVRLKGPAGIFQTPDLKISIKETMTAVATAWLRCLRGPGGIRFCLDNLWIFEDRELAAEVLDALARNPVVYVSLIKETADTAPIPGLESVIILEYLLQGVLTSEYSLTNLLRQCLAIAVRDPQSINQCAAVLGPVSNRLLPFLKALVVEYSIRVENELHGLLSLKSNIVERVTTKTDFIVSKIKNAIEEPGVTPKARILGVYADELQYAIKEDVSSFEWKPKSVSASFNNQNSIDAVLQQAVSLLIETSRINSLATTLKLRFLNFLGQSIGLIIEKIQLWLEKNKAIPGLETTLVEWMEDLGLKPIARQGEVIPFDPVLHFEQGDLAMGNLVIVRSTGLKGPDDTVLRKAVVEKCN